MRIDIELYNDDLFKHFQDYSELLDENHFFYKPFTTADVINRNEIKLGGESILSLSNTFTNKRTLHNFRRVLAG